MQESIAHLVHPIFGYGLQLKERLDRGETLVFEIEQAALKGLLLSEIEARRWPDFGGDGSGEGEGRNRGAQQFLGIRYAMVCWLDELFILDSPWSTRWNERKLEAALYGTNDRAWKFWEQAKLAEARGGRDALEVFFLCTMLGFRGEVVEEPERLRAWVAAARTQIARGKGQEWTPPPELVPPSHVPPLAGRKKILRMVATGAVLLVILVPLMALILSRYSS
jgi:type VI secretion system protein ImpK